MEIKFQDSSIHGLQDFVRQDGMDHESRVPFYMTFIIDNLNSIPEGTNTFTSYVPGFVDIQYTSPEVGDTEPDVGQIKFSQGRWSPSVGDNNPDITKISIEYLMIIHNEEEPFVPPQDLEITEAGRITTDNAADSMPEGTLYIRLNHGIGQYSESLFFFEKDPVTVDGVSYTQGKQADNGPYRMLTNRVAYYETPSGLTAGSEYTIDTNTGRITYTIRNSSGAPIVPTNPKKPVVVKLKLKIENYHIPQVAYTTLSLLGHYGLRPYGFNYTYDTKYENSGLYRSEPGFLLHSSQAEEFSCGAIKISEPQDDHSYVYRRYPSGDVDNQKAWAYVENSYGSDFNQIIDGDDIRIDDLVYSDSLNIHIGDYVEDYAQTQYIIIDCTGDYISSTVHFNDQIIIDSQLDVPCLKIENPTFTVHGREQYNIQIVDEALPARSDILSASGSYDISSGGQFGGTLYETIHLTNNSSLENIRIVGSLGANWVGNIKTNLYNLNLASGDTQTITSSRSYSLPGIDSETLDIYWRALNSIQFHFNTEKLLAYQMTITGHSLQSTSITESETGIQTLGTWRMPYVVQSTQYASFSVYISTNKMLVYVKSTDHGFSQFGSQEGGYTCSTIGQDVHYWSNEEIESIIFFTNSEAAGEEASPFSDRVNSYYKTTITVSGGPRVSGSNT